MSEKEKPTSNDSEDELSKFLKGKQNDATSDSEKWSERKTSWLAAIDRLYSEIQTWLDKQIRTNLLTVEVTPITITEQYVGSYQAKCLTIKVGWDTVTLNPRGMLVVGGHGRIDMESGTKRTLIILDKDKWMFATKTPRPAITTEVTKESFNQQLIELLQA
jgi:hypothetical protein